MNVELLNDRGVWVHLRHFESYDRIRIALEYGDLLKKSFGLMDTRTPLLRITDDDGTVLSSWQNKSYTDEREAK